MPDESYLNKRGSPKWTLQSKFLQRFSVLKNGHEEFSVFKKYFLSISILLICECRGQNKNWPRKSKEVIQKEAFSQGRGHREVSLREHVLTAEGWCFVGHLKASMMTVGMMWWFMSHLCVLTVWDQTKKLALCFYDRRKFDILIKKFISDDR